MEKYQFPEFMQKNLFAVIDMIPNGFAFYKITEIESYRNAEFIYANDKYYSITGFNIQQAKEFLSKLDEYVAPKYLQMYQLVLKKSLTILNQSFFFEHAIINDNKEKFIKTTFHHYIIENDEYIILCIDDIDKFAKMSHELQYLAERNRILTDTAEETIFEYDTVNDSFELTARHANIFKISPSELNFFADESIRRIIHPDDFERCRESIKKLILTHGSGNTELRLLLNDDSYCWFKMSYASMDGSASKTKKIVGRLTNINDSKLREQDVINKLLLDPMTGIYNKTATKIKAQEFFRNDKRSENKCHACVVIDIDNFKYINDKFGHMFGDVVIENVASSIKSVIRDEDILGRVGGDEFVVILKDISETLAKKKVNSIRNAIGDIYCGNNNPIKISASIGISFYSIDGTDYETLFKKADTAMYYSKKSGKNSATIYDAFKHNIIGDGNNEMSALDSDINGIEFDRQFIQYINTLCINSKDLDSTINIIIERLAKRYNFCNISILKNLSKEQQLCETHKWSASEGIINRDLQLFSYKEWNGFERVMSCDKTFIIEDCFDDNLVTKSDQEVFRQMRVKSLVNCRINRPEFNSDLIYAFVSNKTRKWSEYDRETLYQICLTLSFFLFLHVNTHINNNEIEKIYLFDRLTGIINYDSFLVKLKDQFDNLDRSKYNVLMYCDVTGLSQVNEHMGYEMGDKLLVSIATILKNEANVKLASRVHSDLFVSFISADNKEAAMHTIDKISSKYATYQLYNVRNYKCKLNIGLFPVTESNMDCSLAVDCANLARKHAKELQNTNIAFYTDELKTEKSRNLSISSDIATAMVHKDVKVFLQPKVDMRTDKVIGAEALVRWEKDNHIQYPDTFVPVLEKLGHIVELDFYMFEETLKIIHSWKIRGLSPVKVSVNFSQKHNAFPDFVDRIIRLTEKYDINPELVEIEVTESCLADDSRVMYNNLFKLKGMGYTISMDDFGTGYSSLDILLSAPIDVVKVDKSFLQKIGEQSVYNDYMIKICDLIKHTGKDVIFEGVENTYQKDFLLEHQCYIGQGYLYSKPIPVADFEKLYL